MTGKCKVCGCTAADCSQCVEQTGAPCEWVEPDLCSACVGKKKAAKSYSSRIFRLVAMHSGGCIYRRNLAGNQSPEFKLAVRRLVEVGLIESSGLGRNNSLKLTDEAWEQYER